MKRAVGYCEYTDCEDYAKGVFLLNHSSDKFSCPRCRELGSVVLEKGHFVGNSNIFKEVRVEYNYCAVTRKFQEIAIVRDENIWGRKNVYTLQTPLIKTDKRALRVAEAILSNLNKYGIGLNGEVPGTKETVILLDAPRDEYEASLKALEAELEASSLKKEQVKT